MTHDRRTPSMDELERRLAELPKHIGFPPTPDIASRIGESLPVRQPTLLRRRTTWLAIAAAALIMLLFAAALPGPRRAVADFLGLPGIRIEILPGDERAPEQPTSIGSPLLLGEQTTIAAAQDAVPFSILMHGEPDEVYLRGGDDTIAVSLIYLATDDLPPIGETGVGMLLMEIRSAGETPFLAKRAMGEGTLTLTTVDTQVAYWIENGELVALPDLDAGGPGFSRRSGNVLIWSAGQTTYRLETMLDMDRAIAIAESLVPYPEADS